MAADLNRVREMLRSAEMCNERHEQRKAIFALIDVVDLLALEIFRKDDGENVR